jgi:hypothetical protein
MVTTKQLIEWLNKYPPESTVGYYPCNANARGCNWRITRIESVEMCDDNKTVAIVGGFE